jgi:hypothetical protein
MYHPNAGDIATTKMEEHLGCILPGVQQKIPKRRWRMRSLAVEIREILAVRSSEEVRHKLIVSRIGCGVGRGHAEGRRVVNRIDSTDRRHKILSIEIVVSMK